MALTKISTGGVKDDAVSADKLAKPIDLADNEKVRLGTGNDLQIYHDGSTNIIDASTSNAISFRRGGSEQFFIGNAELKGGDNKKIKLGTGDDLQIYHDGTDSHIDNITGGIHIKDTGGYMRLKSDDLKLESATDEDYIACTANGSVELYYDNVKTFATDPNGIFVYGPEGGSALIRLYADEGDDNADRWRILNDHSSSNNFNIQNYSTGSWVSGLTLDSSNNATFAGTVSDHDGDVRNIPLAQKTGAYVLVAADAGRAIHITTGGVTVNNSVFSAGHAVTIINDSGSDQTITQGSGLTMYNSADAATGNRTLAGRGMATIWFAGADKAYISGAGLS